jgi:phosphatidylglycerophosphate synthase
MLNGWPFRYFDADWGYFRISLILVYIATLMSLISGIIYVIQNRKVLVEDKKA